MSLWRDIETMCGFIKHLDAGAIDVQECRTLLRRAQADVEIIDAIHASDALRIAITDEIATITFTVERQQGWDIMRRLCNDE